MTTDVASRLQASGIVLPEAPPSAGAYTQITEAGDLVYTAGQIAVNGATGLIASGRLGERVSVEEGTACARQCALNALAQLRVALGDLDRIVRVVKVNVFIASTPDFTQQPTVANGASDLINEVLGEAGMHSRTAVGVAVLPLDSPVEVDLVAQVRPQD